MYRNSDRLLYVISARAEVTWPAFKQIFDYLYMIRRCSRELSLDTLPYQRRMTLRAIDALGHCDVSFDEGGGKIFVAPPVLARLPCLGLPQAVLVGERSPQTMKQLSEARSAFGQHVRCDAREHGSDLALVPQRLLIEAESTNQLADIATALRIRFEEEPPAWSLLHFSSSLDEYLAIFEWSAARELNWKRKDFDISSLQFRTIHQAETPTRLSSYSDRVRNLQIHRLWKNGRWVQIDRDWGRYAVLRETGVNVLVYDLQRFLMAVPASAPLPRLFARALALCSGFAAPFIPKHGVSYESPEAWGFTLFRDVPPQIAEMVATKLGQTLLPYSLEVAL